MTASLWLLLLVGFVSPAFAQDRGVAGSCLSSDGVSGEPLPSRGWITDLPSLATRSDRELVGLRLSIRDVRVEAVSETGFFVPAGNNCRVLVVPAEGSLIRVEPGELIDFQGEFRRLNPSPADGATRVFVYAYTVRKAPDVSVATSGRDVR